MTEIGYVLLLAGFVALLVGSRSGSARLGQEDNRAAWLGIAVGWHSAAIALLLHGWLWP